MSTERVEKRHRVAPLRNLVFVNLGIRQSICQDLPDAFTAFGGVVIDALYIVFAEVIVPIGVRIVLSVRYVPIPSFGNRINVALVVISVSVLLAVKRSPGQIARLLFVRLLVW